MTGHVADNSRGQLGDKCAIAEYWATKPQTYATVHGGQTFFERDGEVVSVEPGSREFFEYADRVLLAWNQPLHDENPFGRIFPYERYRGQAVLEVGCGQGGMAQMWAERGAKVVAVDLNPDAIARTCRRFELFGLAGRGHMIQQEDANALSFADSSFDYAYSWGVLHHSPHLDRSVAELARVVKPGGRFGVMLYNRHSLLYACQIVYLEGMVHAERRFLSPLQLASRYTDGHQEEGNPHTWPITRREARQIFAPYTSRLDIRVLGTEIDWVLRQIMPGLVKYLPRTVLKAWARRWGWSLWISGTVQ
jgi:ubiquinone/menaquinone biosynthesis C-methylase UbiE